MLSLSKLCIWVPRERQHGAHLVHGLNASIWEPRQTHTVVKSKLIYLHLLQALSHSCERISHMHNRNRKLLLWDCSALHSQLVSD
jgi:hypothetical protein